MTTTASIRRLMNLARYGTPRTKIAYSPVTGDEAAWLRGRQHTYILAVSANDTWCIRTKNRKQASDEFSRLAYHINLDGKEPYRRPIT